MASSLNNLTCLLHFSLLLATSSSWITVFTFHVPMKTTYIHPLNCSIETTANTTCIASLYHITRDDYYTLQQIAFDYSVNTSRINPITHGTRQGYLITVPCSCTNSTQSLNGGFYYFYHTTYKNVKKGDIFVNISNTFYSGQAMPINRVMVPGQDLPIDIPCGCSNQRVVTYTVQQNDTLEKISLLLNSTLPALLRMNKILAHKPSFLDASWVLFVPLDLNGVPPTTHTK
ncbi:hypothetical protein PIB30_059001 [Stylosanthes scabra]|uniref:LysM domain-containing protein n=1 Tax=Stylosanthes scabra TaxID=79078 RepID=A0ABU6XLL7_9FABA|nr:hypothetical protein [Stylosanthes scabra]